MPMPAEKRIKIFIFSDALGYDLAEECAFLATELPFRYKLETQLGYSSAAVPTILCGKKPAEHNHFSFFYYDREGKSPFGFFRWIHHFLRPRKIFDNYRVRNRISSFLKKLLGYTGYFNLYRVPFDRLPFFNYCEKCDIFKPGGLAPCENIHDVLLANKIKYHISDWHKSDDFNLDEALELVKKGEVEFLFVYTAGLDSMLHFNVGKAETVKEWLERFGAKVKSILAAAQEKSGGFDLYLFSDHGMTPLTGVADLKSRIEALPYRFGCDYVACYDSTMARVWILNADCEKDIVNALNDQKGHWLSREEMVRFGIDFAENRFGELIFLMDPGMQIAPSDMGAKAIPGMHGYTPDDRYSDALLASSRVIADPPQHIAGMFELMRREILSLRGGE